MAAALLLPCGFVNRQLKPCPNSTSLVGKKMLRCAAHRDQIGHVACTGCGSACLANNIYRSCRKCSQRKMREVAREAMANVDNAAAALAAKKPCKIGAAGDVIVQA